jgi:hypothetical protein
VWLIDPIAGQRIIDSRDYTFKMGKSNNPAPLSQRLVSISVQYGVPESDEMVFNVHFTNESTGFVWDVTYKFSQLATLDHDISMHSDKMREVRFPQIDDNKMAKLVGKGKFPDKLQELDRYRALMEDWIQSLVSRCHLMPFVLYDLVEDWFCLPFGPSSDWRPGRTLSQEDINVLSAQHSQFSREYAASVDSTKSSSSRAGLLRMASGFLKKEGDKSANEKAYQQGLVSTAALPDPTVSLLKVRVQRGQKGRSGRIQYDVRVS